MVNSFRAKGSRQVECNERHINVQSSPKPPKEGFSKALPPVTCLIIIIKFHLEVIAPLRIFVVSNNSTPSAHLQSPTAEPHENLPRYKRRQSDERSGEISSRK